MSQSLAKGMGVALDERSAGIDEDGHPLEPPLGLAALVVSTRSCACCSLAAATLGWLRVPSGRTKLTGPPWLVSLAALHPGLA